MSTKDIETYRDEGAVCLRGLFDTSWIELLKLGIERNLKHPGPNARHYNAGRDTGFYFADAGVWRDIPEYRQFLFDSAAANFAAELMDASKVNLFFDNLFIKDAETPEITPWHHDMPYMPISGDQVCSLWLALDEVPVENSVEYIAGSHRWGKRLLVVTEGEGSALVDGWLEVSFEGNGHGHQRHMLLAAVDIGFSRRALRFRSQ